MNETDALDDEFDECTFGAGGVQITRDDDAYSFFGRRGAVVE